MWRSATIFLFAIGVVLTTLAQQGPQQGDWPSYGRDPGGSRYSPLSQINTGNVAQLKRAWTYHSGEQGRSLESTPILVGGILYFTTQNQNAVALEPETGIEIRNSETKSNARESRGRFLLAGRPADVAPHPLRYGGRPAHCSRCENGQDSSVVRR